MASHDNYEKNVLKGIDKSLKTIADYCVAKGKIVNVIKSDHSTEEKDVCPICSGVGLVPLGPWIVSSSLKACCEACGGSVPLIRSIPTVSVLCTTMVLPITPAHTIVVV